MATPRKATAFETIMLSKLRRPSSKWALKLSRLFSSDRLDSLVYTRHGPPSNVLTLQRIAVPALRPHQVLVDFIAVCPAATKLVHAISETV